MSDEKNPIEVAQVPQPDPEPEETGDARMTFTEHLGELRDRIVRSGIALIATFFICYALSDHIFEVIAGALSPEHIKATTGDPNIVPPQWYTGQPLEGFTNRVRVAGYGSLLVSFPYIVWQLCGFIFPGLHPRERRAVKFLVAGCGILGMLGFCVAYFFVFPLVLPYMLQWSPPGVLPMLRLNETVSIIVKALVGFSIAFQFPMAVMILVYMGVLSPKTLKEYRKIAIVVMAVLSAMFTPPDPLSMVVMLVPLYGLYELSIVASYFVIRHKKNSADA